MTTKRLRVEVDVRTDSMSASAITCRSWGHMWQLVPVTGARRTSLLREGLCEYHFHCTRCGAARVDLFTLPDMMKVSSKLTYPEDYLMPAKHKGTGRLSKTHVRRVFFVRDDPSAR